MINISLLLLNNVEEKAGGLFDFDGTLPLTIFQFLGLIFILELFYINLYLVLKILELKI